MSGVQGHVLGHIARRGVEFAQFHFRGDNAEYVEQLRSDAELYEKAGPDGAVDPKELLPLLITAFVAMLIMVSIRYTVGEVIASLTMIESPTTTAIIEDKPPAYADEPDAPLEKSEPLIPSEAEADVEVMLIKNTPITAKISTSMKLLTRVGGFGGRWRGAGVSFLYHALHAFMTKLLASLVGFNFVAEAFAYVFVSVCLSGFHMAWTHSMISAPSSTPWYRRRIGCKKAKAVLLPSLVFALAQQATIVLPLAVAVAVGVPQMEPEHFVHAANRQDCTKLMSMGLRFLLAPLTAVFVAIAVLLPAAVTLTRIEAALLPETEETIVPFDRDLVVGGLDLTTRGGCRQLFVQAWRSFDGAARVRLLKLYAKLVLMQFAVVFTTLHIILAELYIIGLDRLAVVLQSGVAQLKLMAIEAQENAN